jgi:hypothetical protein
LRDKVKALKEERELEEARQEVEDEAEQEAARQGEAAGEEGPEPAQVVQLTRQKQEGTSVPTPGETGKATGGEETERERESDEETEQLSVRSLADAYREVWDKTRAAVQTIGRIRAQGYLVAKGRHDVSPAEAMRELDDAIQKLKDFRWSVIHDKDK